MYSKVKSIVRTNAGCSDTFNLTTGLMQGECLSPSLFSSFINDLDEAMDDVESMGVTIHGTRITVLKYADDMILTMKKVYKMGCKRYMHTVLRIDLQLTPQKVK